MKPKEKALEIFNKMCNSVDELLPIDVKECALVAIDEILSLDIDANTLDYWYWQEVKNEIKYRVF